MEENEEPFIAPVGLNVPPDVELVCAVLPVPVLFVTVTACLFTDLFSIFSHKKGGHL